MRFILIPILNFLFIFSSAGAVTLFPEDGTLEIKKWYYSPNEISYVYKDEDHFDDVLNAFRSVNIEPINTFIGHFFQDIGLFDIDGNLVLQHVPIYSPSSGAIHSYDRYFSGFTMEVFTPPDWGDNYIVNLLRPDDARSLGLGFKELRTTFIEGGATISGRFNNGDDYVIVNHSTYLGMKYYFEDTISRNISESQVIEIIERELSLKAGNFIYLKGTSSIHLDTIMKALPGGKILLDDPNLKVELLQRLKASSNNEVISNYLNYESDHLNTFQNKALFKAYEQLKDRFDVYRIPGAFTRMKTSNGFSYPLKDINFFNGVSGSYNDSQYFITNKASLVPELEAFWTGELVKLGFDKSLIMYPGVYRGNAGLDCLGSPSP